MSDEEREEIRYQVLNEIAKLEKSADTLNELLDAEVQSDANDWFTTKESNPSKEINEMALDKAKQRLVILSEILRRIDAPGYGICIKCNKSIPFERMKAVPYATRCVKCNDR